jgi:hypothetical protein
VVPENRKADIGLNQDGVKQNIEEEPLGYMEKDVLEKHIYPHHIPPHICTMAGAAVQQWILYNLADV